MWLALNTIGVRPSIFTMTSPTMALSTVSFYLAHSSRLRAGGKEPLTSGHRLWFSYLFARIYLASGHKVSASSCFPSFRSLYDTLQLLVVINNCLIRSHLPQATQPKSHVRTIEPRCLRRRSSASFYILLHQHLGRLVSYAST